MGPRVLHLNPAGMHRNPAFTQAVVVEGAARTVYVGGQNAVNAVGEIVGEGNLAAQVEQVYVNLGLVLAAAGATIHDVIKWTIYVVPGQDFRPALGVFERVWGGRANPAFLVEIEAIAVTRVGGDDGSR